MEKFRSLVRISFLTLSVIVLSTHSALAADEDKPGWSTEAAAGAVLTSGNTDTSTVTAKDVTTYQFSNNVLKFTGSYLESETSNVTSAKAWSLGVRYERIITDRLSFFIGQSVEGDRFKGILQAYNTDIGAKYYLVKNADFYWFGEAGYRYTREHALTYKKNKNYLRFYTELEKKLNDGVSLKYWIEFLPNLTDSDDWQANTELSLSAILTNIFSIKLAYLVKYDNVPNEPTLKPSDRTFTTALVAKF